jgi:hypothetical protein
LRLCGAKRGTDHQAMMQKGIRNLDSNQILYEKDKYNPQQKSRAKNSAFFILNQDIVAWPQEQKCGLKYVIHISWC